jgi:hypothetical protein
MTKSLEKIIVQVCDLPDELQDMAAAQLVFFLELIATEGTIC